MLRIKESKEKLQNRREEEEEERKNRSSSFANQSCKVYMEREKLIYELTIITIITEKLTYK